MDYGITKLFSWLQAFVSSRSVCVCAEGEACNGAQSCSDTVRYWSQLCAFWSGQVRGQKGVIDRALMITHVFEIYFFFKSAIYVLVVGGQLAWPLCSHGYQLQSII